MVLPGHTLEPLQVWSKSVGNELHFTLVTQTVFLLYLEYHCIWGLKSACTPCILSTTSASLVAICEWQRAFYFLAQTVFRPYLLYHCIERIQTSYIALPKYPLQIAQVWSQSVCNEGHFTLVSETVFLPQLTLLCSGITVSSYVALTSQALQTLEILSKYIEP
jgi:hypothetical protein